MTYQETASANSKRTEAFVLAAYLALPEPEFIETGAGIIATHNQIATALADISLATILSALPLGLDRPSSDWERIEGALETVLRDAEPEAKGPERREAPAPAATHLIPTLGAQPDRVRHRLARVARAEPLDAGRAALMTGMAEHGVPGWTRKAHDGACELCAALADGSTRAVGEPFYEHPDCNCIAVPVMKEV